MKLEFYLSPDESERLWALKQMQGRDDLTANEFARILLEKVLWRLCPDKPEFDDTGNIIADKGRGAGL